MKSPPPPPLSPPVPLTSEPDVLPMPLDPIAEELELDELDDEEDDEDDELELDELLKRLVAAANADDAFGAEPDELLLEELELEEEPLDGAGVLTAFVESRPKPLRLPIRRGVISEA